GAEYPRTVLGLSPGRVTTREPFASIRLSFVSSWRGSAGSNRCRKTGIFINNSRGFLCDGAIKRKNPPGTQRAVCNAKAATPVLFPTCRPQFSITCRDRDLSNRVCHSSGSKPRRSRQNQSGRKPCATARLRSRSLGCFVALSALNFGLDQFA